MTFRNLGCAALVLGLGCTSKEETPVKSTTVASAPKPKTAATLETATFALG